MWEKIKDWTKPQKFAAGSGAFLIVVVIAASVSGGGKTPEGATMAEGTKLETRSKAEIERDLAAGVIHAEIRGSLGTADGKVNCQPNRCDVSYRVEKLFADDLDSGLVEAQRNVWRAIFDHTNAKVGTVTLIGDAKTIEGLDQRRPFLRVTCTRDAARQINWGEVDKAGMVALCDWDELVTIEGEPA